MPRPVYTPPGGPPRVERPNPAIYAHMGEENIFRMLEDFYVELAHSSIAGMFPRGEEAMRRTSRKSAAFFVTLLGGPPLYQQQYGRPMMRGRHLPFPIDEPARQEWLACFRRVLDNAPEAYQFPPEYLDGFWTFLIGFSGWMVNTAPPGADWEPGNELHLFGG